MTAKTSFQPTPQHIEVRIEMIRKGISQTDVAKALNRSLSAVSNALAGRRPSFLKEVAEYVRQAETQQAAA